MSITLKFTTTVKIEGGALEGEELMEIINALLERMNAEKEITLPTGRTVSLGDLGITLAPLDKDTVEHDPAKAFLAGATEAQERPPRPGLLSPKQFPG